MLNPLFDIDFYKVDHRRQYPEGTTEIYSNFTPRSVIKGAHLLDDYDHQVVMFGIQHFIHEYLIHTWNQYFFCRDKCEVIKEYELMICQSLGLKSFDTSHIEALHDLGYLPIHIKAIEEGYRVPIGVPVLTIRNTLPEFFWLTNYLETVLSNSLWKPITVATVAFEFKRLLTDYAKRTGSDLEFVNFQAHDFSSRGMSCRQDAAICGSAHLTSFIGTDSVSSIHLANEYYDADRTCQLVGASVPASEHSCMTVNGRLGEFETIKRLITQVYPSGIVSVVADSYNYWGVLTQDLPCLKSDIMARNGKVTLRPDSGKPFDIICGDENAFEGTAPFKGSLQVLWEIFGGTVNEKGYKVLDPHIGLIYGDSITVQKAKKILDKMQSMGFASSNIIFGVGSYSYQYHTRDTFGFAMKATSAVINGERKAIFKDPVTSNGLKTSAKGLLQVEWDLETPRFILNQDVNAHDEELGALITVFKDGKLYNEIDLAVIRKNLAVELDHIYD